jgi:hypothetical protein
MGHNSPQTPDWYPLDVYRKQKTPADWYRLIKIRLSMQGLCRMSKSFNSDSEVWAEPFTIKDSFMALIVNDIGDFMGMDHLRDFGNPAAIRDLSVYEAAFLNNIPQPRDCAEWLNFAATMASHRGSIKADELQILEDDRDWGGPVLQRDLENHPDDITWVVNCALDGHFPVSVNLELDDKSLISAFTAWLSDIRSERPTQKPKNPLKDRDYEGWQKFKILEAFDLLLWAEIVEAHYTEELLANILWPDELQVDTRDRYKKVTKVKIKEAISWPMINQIAAQERLTQAE